MTSTLSRLCAVLSALGVTLLSPTPSRAGEDVQLIPVVSGRQAPADSEVVVLCPALGIRADALLSRGADDGLATRLARSGFRVYLVDPWNTAAASEGGYDGVVSETFPAILAKVKAVAGGAPVTFVGHGLCGTLPVAAAADPRGTALVYKWVALGTRFDWSQLAPRYRQWLETFEAGERATPDIVKDALLTGLRPGLGTRASSVPSDLPQDGDIEETMYRHYERSLVREPPAAVLADVLRWSAAGAMTSQQGWVDYTRGLDAVQGPALLLAGMSDAAAPPEDVIPAVDRLSARIPATFRLLSRANGHREEYGHYGMVVSRHAARDVDQLILSWLAKGGAE